MVKSIIHATPKEKKRDKMSNRYKLKFIEIMAPFYDDPPPPSMEKGAKN